MNSEKETVTVTREEYKELMKEWAAVDELDDEYEKVKFYKNGMPEAWRDTDGSAVAGATQAGTGVWERIDDHGVNEDNWIETLATILSIRTLLAQREAEVYLYTEELDFTIQEAADEMDVGFGRVSGARTRIKEKLEDAKATVERVEI